VGACVAASATYTVTFVSLRDRLTAVTQGQWWAVALIAVVAMAASAAVREFWRSHELSFMDLVTIVGTVLTIAGIGIAIHQSVGAQRAAKEAKTASERAETAARNVRGSLVLTTTIADCVVAIGMMDQIRVHHRENNWKPLPDLCSQLKRRLGSIRSENDNLTEAQAVAIQSALAQFTTLEKQAERQLVNGGKTTKPNVPKMNEVVSEQIDKIHTILTELQRAIRKQDHG
jgi:hypothetical protein